MLALKVPKGEGEEKRRALIALGLLNDKYNIARDSSFVYLPLREKAPGLTGMGEIIDMELKKRGGVGEDVLRLAGRAGAFDVIGDIAVVEFKDADVKERRRIGEALLKVHKNLRVVASKESGVSGEYRVRGVGHVAGERRTVTEHREHGCRLKVDVGKVYFSPRLSHERKRIAGLVRDGENVLVLFGGVAPFAIVIAKGKAVDAYSIEINPAGHKYALENVKLNKLKGKVIPMLGDAGDVLKSGRFDELADRIVMPLPKDAAGFVREARRAAKGGCVMHVYAFCKKNMAEGMGKKILGLAGEGAKLMLTRRVRTYSPDIDQFVFDVKINK